MGNNLSINNMNGISGTNALIFSISNMNAFSDRDDIFFRYANMNGVSEMDSAAYRLNNMNGVSFTAALSASASVLSRILSSLKKGDSYRRRLQPAEAK